MRANLNQLIKNASAAVVLVFACPTFVWACYNSSPITGIEMLLAGSAGAIAQFVLPVVGFLVVVEETPLRGKQAQYIGYSFLALTVLLFIWRLLLNSLCVGINDLFA